MSKTFEVTKPDNWPYISRQLHSMMEKAWKQGGVPVIELRRKEEKRSNPQNNLMWALLSDVSRQVEWYGQYLTDEEWKDVFTVSLRRQKTIPGIDGGFIMIGGRTSKMSKREFSELVALIDAFGTDKGVVWSDKALQEWATYKEAAA